MNLRGRCILFGLGAAFLVGAILVAHPAQVAAVSGEDSVEKLRADLPEVLARTAPGDRVPVTIVLREQVSAAEMDAAKGIPDRAERRMAIRENLRSVAEESQAPLLELLRRGQETGEVGPRIRTLWLTNVVAADVTPAMARRIAAREDVSWVNHNPKREVFMATPVPMVAGRVAIECGVELMRAPDVWNDFGVTGSGTVVAVIDTGACYFHPDLENQVWVNPGEDLDSDGVVWDTDDFNGVDDDGNGFVDDVIGWNFDDDNKDPNDYNGHGTHTAGTVGGDGTEGTQTGMAPGCELMILKVGVQFSDEMDVWNAMQYAADNSADVISMSLGWPHSVAPDRVTWRASCINVLAMGTTMVIAAGNEGTCCPPTDHIRTPGDVPEVITVGAVDCTDAIAGFSSRGPVTWQDVPPYSDFPYPPGLTKPTVMGPGVATLSCDVNGCSGYVALSGTSMATPHVAGAVALMLEANPDLEPEDVKSILKASTVDLGPLGADNDFGWGRLDAYEAVLVSANPVPPVVATVTPAEGFARQNTAVTITGDHFFGNMQVRFGTVRAPSVRVLDSGTLLSSAPANTVLGDVDVTVINLFGSGVLPDGFRYKADLRLFPASAAPGETVQVTVAAAPLLDWGVLMDTALGQRVVKGFETCLAGSADFSVVDHSRRTLPILNGIGQGILEWTVPADASAGDRFYFQALFDGNGSEPGLVIEGSACAELIVE
jgi:serine protease AprX